jgi:hypothetical protein
MQEVLVAAVGELAPMAPTHQGQRKAVEATQTFKAQLKATVLEVEAHKVETTKVGRQMEREVTTQNLAEVAVGVRLPLAQVMKVAQVVPVYSVLAAAEQGRGKESQAVMAVYGVPMLTPMI